MKTEKGIRMMQANGSMRKAAVAGLLMALLVAGGQAVAFEVGQRWVYEYKGPRPGSAEPNAIDGQRIRQVISAESAQGPWVIEERFTGDANTVERFHVGEGRRVTAIDVEQNTGELMKMTYDTPVPYQMPEMEIASEQIVETVLRMEAPDFALPIKVVIWRLEDETVTTPAGEFENCRRYQMTTHSIINAKVTKVPLVEERQLWYHPKAKGLVKEVYRKEPVKFLAWSQEGYTATSVLMAFEEQTAVPATPPAAQPAANEVDAPSPGDDAPASVPLAAPGRRFPLWMPAAVVAVFAAAVLILVKRPRPK